jgi:hypothetical protein
MIRMAFLAASAISTTMPIWAKMLLSSPSEQRQHGAEQADRRPTAARRRDRRALVEADQEEIGEDHGQPEDEAGLAGRGLLLQRRAGPFVAVAAGRVCLASVSMAAIAWPVE